MGADAAQTRRVAQTSDEAFPHVPLVFDDGNGDH